MSGNNLAIEINYTWIIYSNNTFFQSRTGRTRSGVFWSKKGDERFQLVIQKLKQEDSHSSFVLWFRNIEGNKIPKNHMISIFLTHPKKGSMFSVTKITSSSTASSEIFYFGLSAEEVEMFKFDGNIRILCEVQECVTVDAGLDGKEKSIIYEPYLNNRAFSDVQIIIGDVEFAAHKLLLAAHSPVFSNMFSHEIKESISGMVEVTEMDPKIFTEVLRFIYTGKVNNLADYAGEILIAADRYEIGELKLMCEKFLISQVKLENIFEFLSFADKHHAKCLKKFCLENFVGENFKTIVKLEGYQDFLKSHGVLMAECLTKMVLQEE